MTRLLLWSALILSVLLPAPAASAQATEPRHIATQLIAETDTPTAGSIVSLAIHMTPEPGWHGYWKNPGDSGIEPSVQWTLPRGAAAGPLEYPVPGRLIVGGLMNYVYEGPYALLLKLKVPDGLAPGTPLPIRGKFDYLVCTKEVCVPESADLALDLSVGAPGTPPTRRAAFDRFYQALPKPLSSEARFQWEGGRFRLFVPLPDSMAVEEPYFFPLTDGAIDYAAQQKVTRNGDALIIETQAGAQQPSSVEGVLRLRDGYGLSLTARPGVVSAGGPDAPGQGAFAILAALAGAILGGLLLNVMPCVFPILSLKALSLAKAGGDEAGARKEALAYTAGAVAVCLALGAAVLALRAGGTAAGWAFQLQDPRVILLLLLLVTAIALNLAGLFELPSIGLGGGLASAGGWSGAFWTGALAAFVATPCTGPFMAAALGAALLLPLPAALAVFAGLGLGLALPFLILGFVPAARRRLPKPGPWMNRLRHILSVPMFLTALGLAWVLGRQSGVDGMTIGLAAALLLGLTLWWVGRRQGEGRFWLRLAPAAAAVAACLMFLPLGNEGQATASSPLAGEAFSEARLAALRGEGRPVFAYFTADWCITCKVNEKGVLQREEVSRAFSEHKVAVLVGDWTGGDAAIGRFLESQGRSGVPLYIYYAPGKAPEVLPQLLTVSRVVSLTQEDS
ncbi:MAG TPA: protein-disulfide reductase DsbD domain-containing protein [Allosphingosinicella sp.]|nr:protein-disulfide reductase DsbD domain-containing protein [Allosphingosinicella sp.]